MKPMPRAAGWLLLVGLIAGVAALALMSRRSPDTASSAAPPYLTQPVDRGTVTRTVSATGALNPVNIVQVGSQISGTIRTLHADFNTTVQAGQLLAEIDPATLDADLAQAAAQLRSLEASCTLAELRLTRARTLLAQGFVARSQVDEAQASLDSAQANVRQQEAAVDRARTNRQRASIRSPVSGTVVSREVAVGQTVAASLQTPVLFKIAQDLRSMQIETSVSEADVGLLREGQAVSFTVDAFPERAYQGTVAQIRNNYTVLQNVVTYTAVVRARNDDLSLRPGMTGYVSVTVAQRDSVLRLPNAALRYEPHGAAQAPTNHAARQVWRLGADGRPQAVEVRLGLTDTRYAELVAGGLREGDQLIIGERTAGGFAGPKIF